MTYHLDDPEDSDEVTEGRGGNQNARIVSPLEESDIPYKGSAVINPRVISPMWESSEEMRNEKKRHNQVHRIISPRLDSDETVEN